MDKISAGSDRAKVDPCTPLRIIRIMYVHVIRKGGQESDKQLFSVLSIEMEGVFPRTKLSKIQNFSIFFSNV